ncbi:class I SAM-dependent methyltransferase [Geobacter sp. DSM 9736]|uniref:class I SAM-dependent methyltransferase n=1 Tax=Geobacter sp. DSM 9736 TaxID=1277350 RepID=UPI0012FE3FE8|nr:class I SAM-dependent methyltransferase [Geobacter sp. DSM 9736]
MQDFEGLKVYENANPKILELYEGEERVLDIGCGAGALGAAIRKINPKAVVHGVDASPEAGKLAADRLDWFRCMDLDNEPLPHGPERYDLIIFGDVLEHLKNPYRLLSQSRDLLAPSGKVILSLPNIANYSLRLRLLFGRFEYRDTGIMDRTHLRFFTDASAREMIDRCGFVIEERRYISRFPRLCGPLMCGLLAVQFIFKLSIR